MSGLAFRIWSACKGCNTHRYNHILLKEGGKCRTCGRPVALYQPKPKKGQQQGADADKLVGGDKKQKGNSGATAAQDAAALLDQTIAVTTDNSIKQVLIAQRALLAAQQGSQAATAPVPPAEAAVGRKVLGVTRRPNTHRLCSTFYDVRRTSLAQSLVRRRRPRFSRRRRWRGKSQ